MIAVQAGFERERRAKVIAAEGEHRPRKRLAEALEQVAPLLFVDNWRAIDCSCVGERRHH